MVQSVPSPSTASWCGSRVGKVWWKKLQRIHRLWRAVHVCRRQAFSFPVPPYRWKCDPPKEEPTTGCKQYCTLLNISHFLPCLNWSNFCLEYLLIIYCDRCGDAPLHTCCCAYTPSEQEVYVSRTQHIVFQAVNSCFLSEGRSSHLLQRTQNSTCCISKIIIDTWEQNEPFYRTLGLENFTF